MILDNKSFQSINEVRENLNNDVKQLRIDKIKSLAILINHKQKERLLSLLTLKYYQSLGMTNTKDLASHIATERVRYTSNLPLHASSTSFYYEWLTQSTKKANDE